jgi:hypothetical protein
VTDRSSCNDYLGNGICNVSAFAIIGMEDVFPQLVNSAAGGVEQLIAALMSMSRVSDEGFVCCERPSAANRSAMRFCSSLIYAPLSIG